MRSLRVAMAKCIDRLMKYFDTMVDTMVGDILVKWLMQ